MRSDDAQTRTDPAAVEPDSSTSPPSRPGGHRPRRPLTTALLAVALLIGAGCTTFVDPVVTARPGDSTSFEGLAQLATPDEATAIDLLLVHGMCTHDAGWADAAIDQVATMLGADVTPTVEKLAVAQTSADVFGADVTTPHWQARIAAIVWSPIVAPTKAELCQDTTSQAPACRREAERVAPQWFSQTSVAGPIRDRLVDDCMADAVIYLGRARDQINDQMQKALVTAARHFEARRGNETGLTRPLVVITQSLGAKLAFDALLRMQQDYSLSHVGDRLAERTTRVYLAANQLPFLQLGDATVGDDAAASDAVGPAQRRHLMRLLEAAEAAAPAATTRRRPASTRSTPAQPAVATRIAGMPEPFYAADPVEQFIRDHAQRRPALAPGRPLPPLQVVAFNDPHDVMAYRPNPSRRTGSDIIDVTLELEPAALGIVVSPDPAHLNYLRDARVRGMILCGHGQPGCRTTEPVAADTPKAPVDHGLAGRFAVPAVTATLTPAVPRVAQEAAGPDAQKPEVRGSAQQAPEVQKPEQQAPGAQATEENPEQPEARPLPEPIRPPPGFTRP